MRKIVPGNTEKSASAYGWKKRSSCTPANEHAYTHDDWITILPLDRLWAST